MTPAYQMGKVLFDRLGQENNDAALKLIYMDNINCPVELSSVVEAVLNKTITRYEAKVKVAEWMSRYAV